MRDRHEIPLKADIIIEVIRVLKDLFTVDEPKISFTASSTDSEGMIVLSCDKAPNFSFKLRSSRPVFYNLMSIVERNPEVNALLNTEGLSLSHDVDDMNFSLTNNALMVLSLEKEKRTHEEKMQVLLDEVKHSWLSADESEQLSSRFLKSLVSDDLMKDGFFREGLYAFFTQ